MADETMGRSEEQPIPKETLVGKAKDLPRKIGHAIGNKFGPINPLSPERTAEAVGNIDVGIEDSKTAHTLQATARGTATQAPPRIGSASEPSREPRREGHGLGLAIAAGVAVGAIALAGGAYGIRQLTHDNAPDVSGTTGEVIPPDPRLISENWQQIPQNKIKDYANIPQVKDLDPNKYSSTVPPILQGEAKRAGYKIIYSDPHDTTGRTAVTEGRQSMGRTGEDLGFGDNGYTVNGFLEGWVTNPQDPKQQKELYALMRGLTGEVWLVKVDLTSQNPTRFAVDDLSKGPEDVIKMRIAIDHWLPTVFLPDDPTDLSKPFKKLTDFPTFNDVVERTDFRLDRIAQRGDFISIIPERGFGSNTATSQDGILKANLWIERRVDGMSAFEKELNQLSSQTEQK